MSDALNTNKTTTPETESSSGSYVVVAIIVLGVIAVAAYQFLSCATCY